MGDESVEGGAADGPGGLLQLQDRFDGLMIVIKKPEFAVMTIETVLLAACFRLPLRPLPLPVSPLLHVFSALASSSIGSAPASPLRPVFVGGGPLAGDDAAPAAHHLLSFSLEFKPELVNLAEEGPPSIVAARGNARAMFDKG